MNRIQNTYPTLLDELLVTYYPIYELQFYTREEIEYVQGHDVLRVAYVADRRPLSFTDENGELVTETKPVNADFSTGWGSHEEISQLFTSDKERNLHVKIEPQYNEADVTKNRFTIYAFGIS